MLSPATPRIQKRLIRYNRCYSTRPALFNNFLKNYNDLTLIQGEVCPPGLCKQNAIALLYRAFLPIIRHREVSNENI